MLPFASGFYRKWSSAICVSGAITFWSGRSWNNIATLDFGVRYSSAPRSTFQFIVVQPICFDEFRSQNLAAMLAWSPFICSHNWNSCTMVWWQTILWFVNNFEPKIEICRYRCIQVSFSDTTRFICVCYTYWHISTHELVNHCTNVDCVLSAYYA